MSKVYNFFVFHFLLLYISGRFSGIVAASKSGSTLEVCLFIFLKPTWWCGFLARSSVVLVGVCSLRSPVFILISCLSKIVHLILLGPFGMSFLHLFLPRYFGLSTLFRRSTPFKYFHSSIWKRNPLSTQRYQNCCCSIKTSWDMSFFVSAFHYMACRTSYPRVS